MNCIILDLNSLVGVLKKAGVGQYIEHPLIKPQTIQSRLYQQILYAAGVKQNSLVILPTGLGKTVIIIMVMAQFLNRDPQTQVVLIAPTRPLVDQHYTSCTTFLNIPPDQIQIASGSTEASKRSILWREARVIISTPQTIRNDIINKRMQLERISLMCFDEAHRAVGEDPYVLTAEQYHKQNPIGRILGFTASPGKTENLQQVVDNLALTNIEYMDEDHPQVNPYVHETTEKWIWVNLPPEIQEIQSLLSDLIQSHLSTLKEIGIINSIQIQKNPKRKLLSLPTKLNKEREAIGDDSFFAGMSAYGQLMLLTQASEMLETQGINTFDKYIEAKRTEYQKSKKKSLNRFLTNPKMRTIQKQLESVQEQQTIHPKIEEIKKLISSQLKNNVDSRILVFSNYKSTIEFLVDQLSSLPNASVHRFVGQTSSAYGKGLTQKQQKSVMNQFRSGNYNVLVSSSVGEEGLDVAQCDLVIFYDLTPSATRLIQRSGRTGRARAGKVIYLITKGTRDEAYFYASKNQKMKIKQSVLDLKNHMKEEAQNQSGLGSFFTPSEEDSQGTEDLKHQISAGDIDDMMQNESLKTDQLKAVNTSGMFQDRDQELVIYVDYREKGAGLYRELMNTPVKIQQENLPIGDFVVSSEIGIERKTTRDFVDSLINRNLFEQLILLKRAYIKPLLVIEGDDLYASSVHHAAIQGALSAIMLDLKIPIMFTNSTKETVEMLVTITKREQGERKKTPLIRKDKPSTSTYEEQIYLLSSLPNIDRTLAERITRYFGNLREFFQASQDELRKIHGIGPQIADRIDLLLSSPFDEDEA